MAVTPAVSSRRLLALASRSFLLLFFLIAPAPCALPCLFPPAALPVRAKETAVIQRLSLSQCRSRLLRSSSGAAFALRSLLPSPRPFCSPCPQSPQHLINPAAEKARCSVRRLSLANPQAPPSVDHPSDTTTSAAEKTKTSVPGRMPFHWPNKNNRSQHNLVGSSGDEDGPGAVSAAASTGATSPNPGAGAANQNPPAALSNPAFSSSESFHAHSQPPPPPPHLANLYNTASAGGPHPANILTLQHSNTVTGSLESRQRDSDFVDPVTRSQSQRYAQVSQISPVSTQYSLPPQQLQQQQQQQYIGSGSAEDLTAPGAQISPVPSHGQVPPQAYYTHQQAQQQSQAQPQRAKQSSTRKLIKNILGGSSSRGTDAHHHSQQSFSSGNSSGLGRHHSKRVSQPPAPPPAIRTGVSQISLDQQADWQQNQPPASQTSPHQSTGDFRRESYVVTGADGELHSHPLHGIQQQNPTIRSVPPSESEHSPYSPDDVGYHHQRQSHIQLQGQVPSEVQHQQQYQQQAFDPTHQPPPHQQQYQFPNHQLLQYQPGGQQVYTGHLASPRQNQNAETVSQLSHESPITDSDQRSGTNIQSPQPSPAVNYATASETQDLPVRQNPPSAQAQSPQQGMTPPAGGGPPPRRSQETEKGMRDPVQPPPGPPPSYRQSQAPNMNNPLPPPPPNTGGGPNAPAFRASTIPDRPPFDGPGDVQGRNSPQPASGAGEDPEKAFKDLCRTNPAPISLSNSRLELIS